MFIANEFYNTTNCLKYWGKSGGALHPSKRSKVATPQKVVPSSDENEAYLIIRDGKELSALLTFLFARHCRVQVWSNQSKTKSAWVVVKKVRAEYFFQR
jgi:hypothetical protein